MRKNILIIIGFILIFVSCNPAKKDWQKAEEKNSEASYENSLKKHPEGPEAAQARANIEKLDWQKCGEKGTLEAYEEFLRKHPQGELADQARENKQKILASRTDDFRFTKTIYFEFRQRFYNLDELESELMEVNLPVLEIAQRIAGYAGLITVSDETADVQCRIQITGFKTGLGMSNLPHYNRDSGPVLFGTIVLTTPKTGYYRTFIGTESHNQTPSDYPGIPDPKLGSAFYFGDYIPRLLEMFAEYYGPSVLWGALHDENLWIKGWTAIVISGCSGKNFKGPRDEDIDNTSNIIDTRRYLAIKKKFSSWGEIRHDNVWAIWIKSPVGIHLLKGAGFDLEGQELSAWGKTLDLPELSITQLKYFKPTHLSQKVGDIRLRATPFLLRTLEDEHWWVRKTTATALGAIKSRQAVPTLITKLRSDPNRLVRGRAAQALGNIGDPSAIDALEEAVEKMLIYAKDALEQLKEKKGLKGRDQ
ncbi:MAG: hypothetical protein GTO45_23650 [Candidatus Aminicenantes bacterium]|nr:hypothetical protein [Candidatus Aminicenantes bacterium]NIM81753.1 hypothetical protein [Candidatus Aminicenantes bacterium]NIN21125.1 hypothetical protein [Candidatus Aminicenantes bacterium]NIN44947.1 hypothetical protein [Candidatus Aminicenantes bacterium]NIN87761.1 hypothetical protein [Candidatus Aminicenantes bacterium]